MGLFVRTFAACVAGLALGAGSAQAFSVTGYVQVGSGDDAKAINAAATTVTDYGLDGASLTSDGSALNIGDDLHAALAAAKATGKPSSLLISNYDNDLQDFSPALASKALDDPGTRTKLIDAITSEVTAAGWDGVTIDLESLSPGDRAQLVAFMTELRAALPAAAALDEDVPAGTDPTDPYLQPFDLASLAPQVDHLVLMAYDQHYQGGTAGPIAGLSWFKKVIAAATAQVDPSKLRIGIAGYGYRWFKGKAHKSADLTVSRARKLAGRRGHWNKTQGEWTATLRDHSVLWWSDKKSVAQRVAIAEATHAQGIAVWRLGSADPLNPIAPVAPTPVPSPGPTPTPTPCQATTQSVSAAGAIFCPLAVNSCPCSGPIRAPVT